MEPHRARLVSPFCVQEQTSKNLPIIRDYDAHIYVREFGPSFMMGAFEKLARPWTVSKNTLDPALLQEEQWRHFDPYIRAAQHRLPILQVKIYQM